MVQSTAETPEQTSCPLPQGNRRKSRDEEVYSDCIFTTPERNKSANKSGGFCCRNGKKPLFTNRAAKKGCGGWPQKRKSGAFLMRKKNQRIWYNILHDAPSLSGKAGTLTSYRRFDSCWRNRAPSSWKAGGAFCATFFHKVWPNGVKPAAVDLSGGLAAVPAVQGTSTESKLME